MIHFRKRKVIFFLPQNAAISIPMLGSQLAPGECFQLLWSLCSFERHIIFVIYSFILFDSSFIILSGSVCWWGTWGHKHKESEIFHLKEKVAGKAELITLLRYSNLICFPNQYLDLTTRCYYIYLHSYTSRSCSWSEPHTCCLVCSCNFPFLKIKLQTKAKIITQKRLYLSRPYTDVDKIVGTLPLKEEKATMVTEITWNWQK